MCKISVFPLACHLLVSDMDIQGNHSSGTWFLSVGQIPHERTRLTGVTDLPYISHSSFVVFLFNFPYLRNFFAFTYVTMRESNIKISLGFFNHILFHPLSRDD
jgi:hypothetical protein